MKLSLYSILILFVLLLCNGCVTRTNTRRPNSSEAYRLRSSAPIVKTKTVWFWDEDY